MERFDDPPAATAARPSTGPRVRRSSRADPFPYPERSVSEQLPRLFPVFVLVGVSWTLSWKTFGSITARDWLPYALLAALVLAGALLAGGRVRPNRLCTAALATLVVFAGWTALSLTWAPIPSLARDEALLVLFYAIVLAVAMLTLRTADDRTFAGGAVAGGAVLLTLAAGLKMRSAGQPADLFFGGRLDFPITYINAQAAAMLVGFWPAIVVAARRTAPVWVRAPALGGATCLLCGWLLTQSKGGALGLVISAIVVFALSDARLRLAVPVLLAGILAAIGSAPLTAPIRATDTPHLAGSIRYASSVLFLLTLSGVVAGAGYALADRRLRLSARAREAARGAAVGFVILTAVAAASVFVSHHPGRLWNQFAHRQQSDSTAGTHLLSFGSNRYDFWRVALIQFEQHPIAGVSARGFATVYLRHRRSDESPVRAHSLEADVLSETGLVGFVLVAGSLGLLLLAAGRRARLEPAAAGALGGAVYVLVHSSVDWIWTFPAVGLPLFLLLGAGASSGRGRSARLSLRTAVVVSGGAVLLGLVAFGPPWLSAKYNERAAQGGSSALADARQSRRLDPLSVDALLTESQLAPNAKAALPPLEAAVRREPRSYAMHYVLAFGYYRAGQIGAARSELLVAHELNPLDPIVSSALAKLPKQA